MTKPTVFACASMVCLAALLGPSPAARAASCAEQIKAVDAAISKQYGEDRSWWNIIACPVCLGSTLRKDAVVTQEQMKEVSRLRNFAAMMARDKAEKMCMQTIAKSKALLKLR